MNDSGIQSCISLELLHFIRDSRPTEAQVLDYLGPQSQDRYYTLKKAGALRVAGGVVALDPAHCSEDGRSFWWGNMRYHIDDRMIDVY